MFQNITHQMSNLNEKVQSKSWVAGRLEEWRMVDAIYSLPFDRAAFRAAMEQEMKKELDTAKRSFGWNLLRLASHFKHATFSQECEWRLALPHRRDKPMLHAEVLWRGTDPAIPYVASSLFQERLPITEVIAGPLCIESERVKSLLAQYGHQVQVSKSSIPMRNR